MMKLMKKETIIDVAALLNKYHIGHRRNFWVYNLNGVPFMAYKKNRAKIPENLVPLTDKILLSHLNGAITIGVSPFVDDENVCRGTIDIDAHDLERFSVEQQKRIIERNKNDMVKLYRFFTSSGYTAIVTTCNQTGWHIDVLSPKTSAQTMRLFLQNAQGKVLGAEKHEIFPKQNRLSETRKGFGNQLKLILGIHPKKKKRVTVFDVDGDKQLNLVDSFNFLLGVVNDN